MAAEISVEASQGGFGAARDQTVNYAPSPELVEILIASATRPLEKLNEDQRKEIQDLRNRLGTSDGILHRVAAILTEHLEQGDIDFARLPQMLVELIKHRQAIIERERTRPQDPDAAFSEIHKKLQEALAAGDDEQARQLYEQKRDTRLAAMKKRREAAERLYEAATRDLLDAAESEASLGELARGRLEYRRAAEHFRAAAELLSGQVEHASIRLDYLDRAAEALYKQGGEFGDNQALREAMAIYKAGLEERTRARVPLQWAATQTNLGLALGMLGERESGTERLEEAVAAYRAALQERTRARVPLQWAATQTNLGTALSSLGERTHERRQLEEARSAISTAFNVFMQAGQQQYQGYFEDRLHEIDRQISALKTAR